MIEVMNETNCVHDTTVFVEIFEDFLIYLPNSFTPDGDGFNDTFGPKGTDLNPNDYRMQIFDRWGTLIFETRDLNEQWAGQGPDGNEFVPSGVYVYRIIIRSETTWEKRDISGNVTLIR